MSVESPNLADHPMFAKSAETTKTMEEVAGRAMLEDQQRALDKQLGIDPKQAEAEKAAHEASEAEARRQWNEFGSEAVKTTVEPPKEAEDDPLL